MGKAIEVVWKKMVGGEIRPIRIDWKKTRCMVDSVGRRWKEFDGEHILVMLQPNNRVIELLFLNEDEAWEIVKGENWLDTGKV